MGITKLYVLKCVEPKFRVAFWLTIVDWIIVVFGGKPSGWFTISSCG